MKIVYIITGLGMGGAENLVVNLAQKVSDRGHEVKIVYLTGPKLVEPQKHDIEVISLGMQKKIDFFKTYISLRKLIIQLQPDVIHSHMVHANIFTRLLRITTKIKKLICTIHSTNEGNYIRTLAYKITDALTDITTSVSQDAVESAIKRGATPPNKIICIPNGIDIEKFSYQHDAKNDICSELNINYKKKIIVAAGRLDKAKDYPNLFHALSILKETRDDFIVLIAGTGPLKDVLLTLAEKLHLNNHILFLGIRRDMPKLLSAGDVFVLSSEWEGLPLIFGEAMACECIIAATDCGGVKEYIGDIDTLTPIKNPKSLAQKINDQLNITDNKKADFKYKSRQRIKNFFSIESMTDKYISLYSPNYIDEIRK